MMHTLTRNRCTSNLTTTYSLKVLKQLENASLQIEDRAFGRQHDYVLLIVISY